MFYRPLHLFTASLLAAVLAVGLSAPPPCTALAKTPESVAAASVGAEAVANAGRLMTETFHRYPVWFEQNLGQAATPDALFLGRSPDLILELEPTRIVMRPATTLLPDSAGPAANMVLLGANPGVGVAGGTPLPISVGYLVGNDQTRWVNAAETFSTVRYSLVYPGIDLVYHSVEKSLEYDFVVAPQADTSTIRLGFERVSALRLDGKGSLTLETEFGPLVLAAPVAWQERNGAKETVACRFEVSEAKEVGFAVGDYDRNLPLVIDPTLIYSAKQMDSAGFNPLYS